MTENNPIIKRTLEVSEDFSTEHLDEVFLENPNFHTSSNPLFNKKALNKTMEIIEESSDGDRLYIITPKYNPKKTKKVLNDALERGVVVYIVTLEPSLLKEYYGKILVRESRSIPDICLILRESTDGLTGALSKDSIEGEKTGYILELDPLQALDLKKYFANTFWNRSSNEFTEERRDAVAVYDEFLYDRVIESKDSIVDMFEDFLLNYRNIYCFYNNSFDYIGLEDSHLYINGYKLDNLDFVKSLSDNNSVFFNKTPTQDTFFFNEEEGFYISNLPLSEDSFIIMLNNQQLTKLKDFHILLAETSQYRYYSTIKVREIEREFFYLEDSNKTYHVKNSITKKLPSVSCENIDEFINYNLEDYTRKHIIFDSKSPAREYIYLSEVYPPSLPKGSKNSRLIREWEECSKEFNNLISKEIGKIQGDIKTLEEKSGIIFSIYKKLKIPQLKFNINKLENLQILNLHTLTPDEREKKLLQLSRIRGESQQNKEEFKLKVEEEKWAERKNNLEDALKSKENELKLHKKNLEELEKETPLEIDNEITLLKREITDKLTGDIDYYNNELETVSKIEKHLLEIKENKSREIEELEGDLEKERNFKIELESSSVESEKEKDQILSQSDIEIKEITERIKSLEKKINKKKSEGTNITDEIVTLLNKLADREKNDIFNKLSLKNRKRRFSNNLKAEKILDSILPLGEKLVELASDRKNLLDSISSKSSMEELKELCKEDMLKNLYSKYNKNINKFRETLKNSRHKLDLMEKEKVGIVDSITQHGKTFSKKLEKSWVETSLQLPIPEEEINRVGKLFNNKEKRYLVISDYSELELAKEESKRLGAKICVDQDFF